MFLQTRITMFRVTSLYLGIVLAATICPAQLTTTGTITGTVRDASGAVVPGASIKVLNQNTGVTSTTQTNSDGSFVVPALPV
ncbi:MAG TPA: carboxypeptidase-like regulatory domain-containing protein, partial [Terriglobia bacterium]|nr:carboxypeptidase-like regulatory domain-containing protein [Terriglobia bacterium]